MKNTNIDIKRMKLGLTQKQLAEKLGVSVVTINKWENQKITPRKKYIDALDTMIAENPREVVKAFRPIQYLGSKLRLLEDIEINISEHTLGDNVCDLFSGSGVVSNYLSSKYKVIASDIQSYSCVLTEALLDFKYLSNDLLESIISEFKSPKLYQENLDIACQLIDYEMGCIKKAINGDAEPLIRFSEQSSLYIHNQEFMKAKKEPDRFSIIKNNFLKHPKAKRLVITNLYGGVYFSFEQAIFMDVIRQEILKSSYDDSIKKTLLSALIGVASEIVNTVGKQFAQPMKLTDRNGFAKKLQIERTIRDKNYSVLEIFEKFLIRLNSAKKHVSNREHEVHCGDSIEFLFNYKGRIDCFYADPPYTIDHYSRFYHVLETIAKYDFPTLATMKKKGELKIMNGLYRVDRYQSPFCIPSQVKDIFELMIKGCAKHGAPLIISYSPYDNSNDERSRLLKTEEIKNIAEEYYPKVIVKSMNKHVHRKLHSTNKNSTSIENSEIFIICSGITR